MAAHKRKLQMQLKMIYKEAWKSLLKKSLYDMICVLLVLSVFVWNQKCIKHIVRRNCILGAYIKSLSNIDGFLIYIYFYLVVFVIVFFLSILKRYIYKKVFMNFEGERFIAEMIVHNNIDIFIHF